MQACSWTEASSMAEAGSVANFGLQAGSLDSKDSKAWIKHENTTFKRLS